MMEAPEILRLIHGIMFCHLYGIRVLS